MAKIIIITIIMFIATIYAISVIQENGKEVNVGAATCTRHITTAGCIAIVLIAVAFDVACVYILLMV